MKTKSLTMATDLSSQGGGATSGNGGTGSSEVTMMPWIRRTTTPSLLLQGTQGKWSAFYFFPFPLPQNARYQYILVLNSTSTFFTGKKTIWNIFFKIKACWGTMDSNTFLALFCLYILLVHVLNQRYRYLFTEFFFLLGQHTCLRKIFHQFFLKIVSTPPPPA